MNTTFKSIYTPIKNGITGEITKQENKINDELIKSVIVVYDPLKPVGKWVISAKFFYKGQYKTLMYGKEQKEIRVLVQDLNDFDFDPYLFLNQ